MTAVGQARSPRPNLKGLLARQMNPQNPDTVAAAAPMVTVCQDEAPPLGDNVSSDALILPLRSPESPLYAQVDHANGDEASQQPIWSAGLAQYLEIAVGLSLIVLCVRPKSRSGRPF